MALKIAVYAICKNEAENALEWLQNVKSADVIIAGDTGSSDGTMELLRENGAVVHDINVPFWRFDEARNRLLRLVPEDVDVCVPIDFDERISPGWREEIEAVWIEGTTRLSYRYTEKTQSSGAERSGIASKIHCRYGYRWIYPVHEVLSYRKVMEELQHYAREIEIIHRPDESKDRRNYLELMELAVAENPMDMRLTHQLGRDYMLHGFYDNCIAVMHRNMGFAGIEDDRRRACLRFIARAYGEKGEYEKAAEILKEIIKEAPYCGGAYVEHAVLSYKYGRWDDVAELIEICPQIDFTYRSLYNEFFGSEGTLYDIFAIACYNRGDLNAAVRFTQKALDEDAGNERLNENMSYYKSLIEAGGEEL